MTSTTNMLRWPLGEAPELWYNFLRNRDIIPNEDWKYVLNNVYRGNFKNIGFDCVLQFDSDEDLIMFILRFAKR